MVQARWYNEETGTWEKFIVSNEGIQGPPGPLPDEDKIVRDLKEKVETDLEPTLLGLSEAELARAQAELDRQAQEEARETAEGERDTAEVQRKADHANRSAEFDGKADKVVVENFVKNGDFSNGTTGWQQNYGHEILSVSEGSLSIKREGAGNVGTFRIIDNSGDIGDVVYFSSVVKTATNNRPRLNAGLGEVTSDRASIIDEWVHHSWQFELQSVRLTPILFFYNASDGRPTFIDNVMGINLTKVFGKGNEPTKEEIDELIKFTGYIDGEYALNNKGILYYLMKGIREKADKKQEDWITPTLLNGATGALQFRKNQFGRVEFRGTLTGTQGIPMFQLPSGYRSNGFTTLAKIKDSSSEARAILFHRNGEVYFKQPYGTSEVYFDDISFNAE